MNTPVSFELAKLLEEKQIFLKYKAAYPFRFREHESKNYNPSLIEKDILTCDVKAPTIAEIVMWIHKEKGLWINVMYMGFELKYSWSIDIITTAGSNWDSYGEEGDVYYNSPTEAYEAAIKYTLENLIQ